MVDAFKAVYAKKEATYGVDAVPTAGTDAILTRNFSTTPLQVDQIDRNLDRPSRGALPSTPSNPRQVVDFEVELAGAGAAGTAPPWMDLLQGCGMDAPVVTANTSAVQRFAAVGTALSSLSLYHFQGNQRRKGIGARGDISAIDFTAGAYPFLGFNFTALVPTANPFDTAVPPAPDFSDFGGPLEVNTQNTLITLGGYAAALRYLRLQANANVSARNLVGRNYVNRGNHALKGKMLVEAVDVGTQNYYAALKAGTLAPLAVTHGTVAGNIVQLSAGYLQILAVADNVEDDVLMYELDIQLNVNAGQDDLIITAR
jgi:hypothetical protein